MMMMTTIFVCEKKVCLLCAGRKCENFRESGVRTRWNWIEFLFFLLISPSQGFLLCFVQVANGAEKACGFGDSVGC